MKKGIIFILSVLLVFMCFDNVSAKSDYDTASKLVEQAISQKSFYYYNLAYAEVMSLENDKEKNELLERLNIISGQIWNEDVKDINKFLQDMVNTASGRIYDNIQDTIMKADIPEVDKSYFLGEVTSWGKKLVWNTEYSDAVNLLIKAYNNKDASSCAAAKEAINKVENIYSKEYLLEQLKYIEVAEFKVESIY